MKRSYLQIGLVTLTIGASMTRPAAGSDPARVAQARWGEGANALAAGDLDAARAAFLAAYEALPNPELAQSLGEVEYRSRHFADAVRHLRIALASDKLSNEERAHTRGSLEKALENVGVLSVDLDVAGVDVMLDGSLVGRSPLSRQPWYLDPGDYVVAVQRQDAPGASKKIAIKAGETTSVSFSLTKPPTEHASLIAPTRPIVAPAAAPEGPSSGGRTALLVAGGSAAAIAAGAGIYFVLNRSSELGHAAELHDQTVAQFGSNGCSSGSPSARCLELANTYDTATRDKTLAWVSFGAAGVFGLATAATALLWPRGRSTVAGSVRVAPWLEGGKGIVVIGNF